MPTSIGDIMNSNVFWDKLMKIAAVFGILGGIIAIISLLDNHSFLWIIVWAITGQSDINAFSSMMSKALNLCVALFVWATLGVTCGGMFLSLLKIFYAIQFPFEITYELVKRVLVLGLFGGIIFRLLLYFWG